MPELLAGDPLQEPEVAPQQLDDRTVCHRAAVRHARRLHLEGARGIKPAQELVEQARLAHARLSRQQHNGALAIAGAPPGGIQQLELSLAPDQRREPALSRGLESCLSALAHDRVGPDGLGSWSRAKSPSPAGLKSVT